MSSKEVVEFIKERLDAESEERISLSKICEEVSNIVKYTTSSQKLFVSAWVRVFIELYEYCLYLPGFVSSLNCTSIVCICLGSCVH